MLTDEEYIDELSGRIEAMRVEYRDLEHLLAIAIRALHDVEDCQSLELDATKVIAANALAQLGWRAEGVFE